MMRALLAAVALMSAAPALSHQQDDPAAVTAAERLVDAMSVDQQMQQMFGMMAPMMAKSAVAQLEAGQASRPHYEAMVKGDYARKQRLEAIIAEEFMAAIRAQMPRLKREYAREYAAAFTAAELDALTQFFSAGVGAKFIAKTPELNIKTSQIGQRIGIEVGMVAMPKALERAKTELDAETKQ